MGEKDIKHIDIQKVVQDMSGWLCKTKRLRGFNLQLHLGAFQAYRFADRFNWVYIGLTWLIRVGECMAAAAAFFVPDDLI